MNDGAADTPTRSYRMAARAEAAQATASRVLDEAVELFSDHSYEDVSLDEVASRAGVTKRTVLRRFGSKDELFVTAMQRAVTEMMHGLDEAPVGDVAGAVANVMDHYERWGRNRLRLLAQEDRIAVVADNVAGGRLYHRSWVERTFEPLIRGRRGAARKRRVATLMWLTDVTTWKLLRQDLELSRADVERVIVEQIQHLEGA